MADQHPSFKSLPTYPLTAIADEFVSALAKSTILLEAEPGAGKSTLSPLWALAEQTDGKQVWLVQPRILAAQTLAQRLSHLMGEPLGKTIGYQVAYENRVSTETRLYVMTPGIALQKLIADPLLESVGCVLLDEVHERGWQQDLLWTLLQEAKILREDLRLVLMSATPDPQLKKRSLQVFNASSIFVAGNCFPVTTSYIPPQTANKNTQRFPEPEPIDQHLIRALNSLKDWQEKTILVFLPGWFEIEKAANRISEQFPSHPVFRLHSRVANQEQQKALDARLGPRIILSTNIAETSLTIEDVNCVIDSGLANKVEFEQGTGLSRLKKTRISQASADQRRGRAGRLQAGHCIRLWSQDQPLVAADSPEIRNVDLLPLALNLRLWGTECGKLEWIESPNLLAIASVETQLQSMGFLNDQGVVTELAQKVPALGTHPRVAAFLLSRAAVQGLDDLDWLIALALHFDFNVDLKEQESEKFLQNLATEYAKNFQWQQQLKRWQNQVAPNKKLEQGFERKILQKIEHLTDANFCESIATAYQDRIGFLQPSGKYRLNSGMSLRGELLGTSASQKEPSGWAVFPWIRSAKSENLGLGFALRLTELQKRQLSQVFETLVFKKGEWQIQKEWRMGDCLIDQQTRCLSPDELKSRLIPYLRTELIQNGLESTLPLQAIKLLERARIAASLQLISNLAAVEQESSNETLGIYLSSEYLIAHLDLWLLPFLRVNSSAEELPWLSALEYYLGFDVCAAIKHHLPAEISLPSGRAVGIEYETEGEGVFTASVSGKLQEFFGCGGLKIAQGKIPLTIHLLSPNGSPLAITKDLTSFWKNAYPEVRKEMRGRYPRHPWPDDPEEHIATALTKRALSKKIEP